MGVYETRGDSPCWASGGPRAQCDSEFDIDLGNACNGSLNPMCGTLRGSYADIVRGSAGDSARAVALAMLECAAWVHDWETNCE